MNTHFAVWHWQCTLCLDTILLEALSSPSTFLWTNVHVIVVLRAVNYSLYQGYDFFFRSLEKWCVSERSPHCSHLFSSDDHTLAWSAPEVTLASPFSHPLSLSIISFMLMLPGSSVIHQRADCTFLTLSSNGCSGPSWKAVSGEGIPPVKNGSFLFGDASASVWEQKHGQSISQKVSPGDIKLNWHDSRSLQCSTQ